MRIYYCENFPRQISQHRLAYLLLERGLEKEYPEKDWKGVTYEKDSYGKPYLKEYRQIQFNISHCKTCVACVIGTDRVGIDVERRFPWKEALGRKICHAREWEWLNEGTTNKNAGLNLLWSRKESYLKCIGTGIRSDLRAVNTLQIQEDGEYFFREYQTETFTLTVCSRENGETIFENTDWQDLWR